MNKTEHYNLNQWDPEDPIRRTDFNADNAKLDAALKAQTDALTAQNAAWGNAVAAEAQARQAAVTAEAQAWQAAVTAEAQARQSLATQITQCGNCKIVFGTYTGDGTYGVNHPNSLTFPQKPLLVIVQNAVATPSYCSRMLMFQGASFTCADTRSMSTTCWVKWEGNSISWYSGSEHDQCNRAIKYVYVALIALDGD